MAKVPTKALAGKLVIGATEIAVQMTPRQFKTGSVGYIISEKIELEGKKYQFGANVVEIGTKKKDN